MSGGQGRGLIEKEKLRIAAGTHEHPGAPFELEAADDPGFGHIGRHNFLPLIVQDAPVAHEQAPFRRGDNRAKGRHAILSRHSHELSRIRANWRQFVAYFHCFANIFQIKMLVEKSV